MSGVDTDLDVADGQGVDGDGSGRAIRVPAPVSNPDVLKNWGKRRGEKSEERKRPPSGEDSLSLYSFARTAVRFSDNDPVRLWDWAQNTRAIS